LDKALRELFLEEFVSVREQCQKDRSHVFGSDGYRIIGLKPLDKLAFCYVGSGPATVMHDGNAETTNVTPEIVARMFSAALFHDLFVAFVSSEMAFGDHILAS
jgi:hypothetical protein